MEELLTVKDAAARLHLTVKTIHRLVREGALECVQVTPRRRLFTEDQIKRFIESRTIKPPRQVDSKARPRLPWEPKPAKKGGENHSDLRGVAARRKLREEMAQWL